MSPFSPIIFFKNLVLEEVNPHMFLTTIGVQGGEVRDQLGGDQGRIHNNPHS